MAFLSSPMLLWFQVLVFLSQSTPFCQQQSATTIRYLKRKDHSRKPIIVGEFRDVDVKDLLPGSKVYLTAQKLMIDSNSEGRFAKEVQEGEYSFLGISVAYETYISKAIHASRGDSIVINFNLKAVNQPLE